MVVTKSSDSIVSVFVWVVWDVTLEQAEHWGVVFGGGDDGGIIKSDAPTAPQIYDWFEEPESAFFQNDKSRPHRSASGRFRQ